MSRPKEWFEYHPAKMEADTADLTLEEFGAYQRLLNFHFLRDSIPADIKRIALILRVSPQKARKLWSVLSHFFHQKDGAFYQKRMEATIAKGIEITEKRKKAGQAGGLASAKAKGIAKSNTITNNKYIKDKSSCASGDAPPPASRFEEWWSEYPNKRNKKQAKAKWKSRKLDAKADILIADTKKRASMDRQWLEGFVPLPTTYINGDRWEDAIEPPRTSEPGRPSIPKGDQDLINFAAKRGIQAKRGESMNDFRVRVERTVSEPQQSGQRSHAAN